MEKETLEDRDKRAQELLQASIEIFTNSSSNYKARRGFIEGAKWQAERMYSEEEVKRLAFDFYYDMSHKMGVNTNQISENATNVDIWFEQLKKKEYGKFNNNKFNM